MPIHELNNTTANYLRICATHALTALREAGADIDAVHADTGLDDDFPAGRMDSDLYPRFVSHLDESGVMPGIGLIVGSRTQLGDLGMLGYASQSSRTFWDGLNVCVPFANQLGWNVTIRHRRLVDGKSEMRLLPCAGTVLPKALFDQWLMVGLTGIRRLMPPSFPLDHSALDFHFPYREPENLSLHRQFFGDCRLHFDSGFCGWRYPAHWNAIELTTRDDIVASFCARELALQQARRAQNSDIVSRVRCFLYSNSEGGFPAMAATARHLNMSVATLRRKLKEHGVTFEALVEEMRKKMAASLIAKSNVTGEELAYQLGYRHSSNFYAAFRGWFGCSPKEYRRLHCRQLAG
jgi:AraC-like DNA-binding protein